MFPTSLTGVLEPLECLGRVEHVSRDERSREKVNFEYRKFGNVEIYTLHVSISVFGHISLPKCIDTPIYHHRIS